MAIFNRIAMAWNAFRENDANPFTLPQNIGPSSNVREYTPRMRYSNERSIISSIYTRIGIDVSGVPIRHIKLDEQRRYADDVDSRLNTCLTFEPNLDQGPRAFRQEIATTLFDNGAVAIVPVDTTIDPESGKTLEIFTLRAGIIKEWFPNHVRISLYNEAKGKREDIILEKRSVAIIENPLYNVMNEPNSTMQRLIRKLNLLDAVDEQSGSGKLDLIIQLPYVIKTEAKKQQAEQRRQDIEFQLKGSKYGIAYTDGTEKITQLNRPAENNLLGQIEYLTKMLYGQLGITEEVMNGTADEKVMINYFNRTIEPLLDAITEGMQRSFLGMVGASQQKERIRYFRDPFKFVTLAEIADAADKLTRNEIASSNEIRGAIGLPPSTDPKADQLVNSNMPPPPDTTAP